MKRTIIALVLVFVAACQPTGGTVSADAAKGSPSGSTLSLNAADAGAGATLTAATTATQVAGGGVTRHLPGTVVTTATGKYYYLIQSDGRAAPFASLALVTASGYKTNMIITITAEELYCYNRGEQITVALPPPLVGNLADGALVKQKGKSDIYAVSDGVAWPIMNETVFKLAGYNLAAVVELPAGSLVDKVAGIGDCVVGLACLDAAYMATCAADETVDPVPVEGYPTKTTTATATNTSTVTKTASTAATSSTETATQTSVVTSSVATTSTATGNQTGTATVVATTPTTSSATVTTTTSSTGTTPVSPVTTIDLSWVYAGDGASLCFNANYFAGANKAVLLVWSGPGADSAKGPVATQNNSRFCWSFVNRGKGLYYFWVDVPETSCGADVCPRDTVADNGAQYMTAPKVTVANKKWLHCETTGCDGVAYWDGTTFTPMGD